MSVIDPSGHAYFFEITDATTGQEYEAFFDINEFDSFAVGDVRYRKKTENESGEAWTMLSASNYPDEFGRFDPELTQTEINASTERCDNELIRVLDGFSECIKKVFGVQAMPEKGLERVKAMVKSRITYDGENLKIKG